MYNSLNFGECLTILLNRFDISGSELAKALNVVPSLVNKWMHNKRIVPRKSKYIEQIAEYICNNVPSRNLEENVNDIIAKFKLKIKKCGEYEYTHKNTIVDMLSNIQGVMSIGKEKDTDTNLLEFTRTDEHETRPSYTENVINYGCHDGLVKKRLPGSCTIIKGFSNIMDAVSQLLTEALHKHELKSSTIMITQFTDMDIMSEYKKYKSGFYNILMEIYKKDWNVIRLFRLNNNLHRNMSILSEINHMLQPGKYMTYYYKTFGTSTDLGEMMIVPGVGALWAFSSDSNSIIDSAMLIRSNQAIILLECWFKHLIADAVPFIEKFTSYNILDALRIGTEIGGQIGNRYCSSYLPYIMTLPHDIFVKYTRGSGHIDLIESYYRINMGEFYEEISHFLFLNICSKKAFEKLITDGEYVFNEIKYKMSVNDVIIYLENLVRIMEAYDNFQVVFLCDNEYSKIPDMVISIKEDDFVKIHYGNLENGKKKILSYYITEPTIVNTYESYFISIWGNIPQIKKDKKILVSWIKRRIDMLRMTAQEIPERMKSL